FDGYDVVYQTNYFSVKTHPYKFTTTKEKNSELYQQQCREKQTYDSKLKKSEKAYMHSNLTRFTSFVGLPNRMPADAKPSWINIAKRLIYFPDREVDLPKDLIRIIPSVLIIAPLTIIFKTIP